VAADREAGGSDQTGVELQGVSRRFGDTLALDEVSLTFAPGTITGLVGKNGAGKSTLINLLSGAIRPSAGQLLIDGKPVTFPSPRHAVDAGIIAVHQQLDIFPGLSVAENVCLALDDVPAFGPMIHASGMRARARTATDRVGLAVDVDTKAGDLSVSHQRMVTIARGVVDQPGRMVILDEPTESLTSQEAGTLFELIRGWREQGLSVIYVSHRLEEVFEIAGRLVVLRAGRVVMDKDREAVTRTELVGAMTGHRKTSVRVPQSSTNEELPEELPGPGPATPAPTALRIQHLHTEKFEDLGLILRTGEILGLAGLVGSGRSSLARVLGGLERDYSGSVQVSDKEVKLDSPRSANSAGIWYMPEDRQALALFPAFEVWEDIGLPILGVFRRFGGWLSSGLGVKHAQGEVDRLRVEPPAPRRKTRTLSGGNQQKVVLSRALQREMKILVLDEPTQGVDIETREEIKLLLTELAVAGTAIIVITSDFEELLSVSDRILVLRDGHVVAEVDPQFETETSLLATASLGERRM
jgi:ABC-type sugar transport system ATPase subunit